MFCTGSRVLTSSEYTYTRESGPIFLDRLSCEGTESSILECGTFVKGGHGFAECDHSRDVAVHCDGRLACQ